MIGLAAAGGGSVWSTSSAPLGELMEQAIAIMTEAHWRSAVHPDRIEGIGAFNDDRNPTFQDPDY
jgi:hypothetical protein